MNTKPFQQALKLFFAFALIVGLFVSASPTSALPQKAAPAADIIPITPDDTNYASQWNLSDTYGINAPMAWGVTTGSSSTVVAVLDTGITTHEDIALPPRLLSGYDFVSGNATRDNDREAEGEGATGRDDIPYDPGDYGGCGGSTWQGTHVTGIIGAKSDNNLGVAGINWNAKILPVRVIGTCGSVIADDIMDGMLWAADLPVDGVDNSPVENTNPANVIHVSASAAGSCTAIYNGSTTYQAAIDSIIAKGIVIVAAAGDQNSSSVGFPANCNGVIAVAATDKSGNRADYSNYGSAVEISAPGGEIGQDGGVLSTSETSVELPESGVDTYAEMDGTAMAAAQVSGVVSLMFDVNQYITPAQVSAILQKTVQAFPSGSDCSTSTCGWGILNGGEAVRFADMPDVIVTDVALSPNTPYFGQEFLVNVTVKNQGGLNMSGSNSRVALQVYVDRSPGTPDADGCIYLGGTDIDQGEFYRNDFINSVPSGQTVTLPVIINNSSDPLQPENSWTDPLYTGDAPSYGYYGGVADPLPWRDGTHKLYVYADANCSLPESFEDNNAYSTYLTVNPFIEGALLYPRQGQNIETDSIPTFKWNKVMDATKYHIYLSGPSGKILDQWYTASQICDTLSPTCSANGGPGLFLKAGNYYWMMQYYKGSTSIWSEKAYFTVGTKAVNLISPALDENLTGYTTTFTWNKVDATSYRLYVLGPGGVVVLDKTSTPASICGDTTCSVQSPTLKAGKHTWKVLASSQVGGTWTIYHTFYTSVVKPSAVTLVSPGSGEPVTGYTPTFTWSKDALATSYRLYVLGPGGVVELDKTYAATTSLCPDGGTSCSVQSPTTLKAGTHNWKVLASSPAGSTWTNYGVFYTGMVKPSAVTLVSPGSGESVTGYTPTFTWSKDALATSYRLYVLGPGGVVVLDKTYAATTSICPDGGTTCSVQSPTTLKAGTHNWRVLASNPAGYTWTSYSVFYTGTVKPSAVTLGSPGVGENVIGYTPTFTWSKDALATSYRLYVVRSDGVVVLDKTYAATTSLCPDTTCSVTSPTLKVGSYNWKVLASNPAGSTWTSYRTFNIKPLVTLILPGSGEPVTGYTPTFTWSKVDGVTSYRLYVVGPGGVVELDKTYAATTSLCPDTTCSVMSPTILKAGTHNWKVLTSSLYGGVWTSYSVFYTSTNDKPSAVTLVSPGSGETVTGYTPTFTWTSDSLATSYRLYVLGPGGVVELDKTYAAAASLCPSTCSVTSPVILKAGTHNWKVLASNPAGYTWTSYGVFYTSTDTPSAVTLISPSTGDVDQNIYAPEFTWSKEPLATSYRLYVARSDGVVKLDKTYAATGICPDGGTTCSVKGPALPAGTYKWKVLASNPAGAGSWTAYTVFNIVTPVVTELFYPVPEPPATVENIGTNYIPIYRWSKVENVTHYLLYVKTISGVVVLNQWLLADKVCDATTCSYISPTLKGGSYSWQVRTSNAAGNGGWTSLTQFSTDAQYIPEAASNLAINGVPNNNPKEKPVYTWTRVPMATSYRLYVKTGTTLVLDKWYRSVEVCNGDVCSVPNPTTLKLAKYSWWVQTYNVVGYGPWRGSSFDVQAASPAAANLSPVGTITDPTPEFTWDKVNSATKYHVYVKGLSGVVFVDQWYDSSAVCPGAPCTLVSPVTFSAAGYVWSVMPYNATANYGPWKSENFTVSP